MSNQELRTQEYESIVPTANGDHNTNPEGQTLDKPTTSELEGLRHYATNGSVTIPVEILENLYLNPPSKVSGHLRQTFGNPTPL